MNFTVKRCLMGLVASASMFGIARAQDEPAGAVQLGPKVQAPTVAAPQGAGSGPDGADLPPLMSGMPAAPGTVNLVQPGSGAYSNYYRLSRVDQILAPRFNVDSRGGGLYGYGAGYSNIGVFVPYKLDDTAILFMSAQGLVTYDGRGGATVGAGWRYLDPALNRITGLSTWYDFDNGHARPYQQIGFSYENLGQFVDYRVNGYLPTSKPDHVLVSDLTANPVLMGNNIGLARINTVEQAFAGFDAEVGGPTPILGQYGLNAYVGGYQFQGMGVNGGSFTGVSGRLLSQINEDVSFGVQVTNDHMFGLNTQFQVFANLPNGKPSRWLRNWRVQDRLVAQTFRQNRVIAKTETFTTYDVAINPETHQAYFVANINPNLTVNGNGSASNPYDSIVNYEAVPLAQRQRYDFILVQPRTDGTSTNLDTNGAGGTLELFNGQHLLSTSTTHTFVTENLPGQTLTLPISAGTAEPILVNSAGGNIITLAPGNTRGMEVSGFELLGNASGTLGTLGYVPATGNGIFGNNILGLNVNNNNIHGTLNGVLVNNLTGTFAAGTEGQFVNNNIHDNSASGVVVNNNGSPPFVPPLDVLVQGNTFKANGGDGMRLVAQGGATIGGVIGGANTAATTTTPAVTRTNTFDGNTANGLNLVANGGTFNFLTPTTATTVSPAFGIFNNIFTTNTLDGLHIDTTNNSVGNFVIQNNQFGIAGTATSGNKEYGIGLVSDSGNTTMLIGGQITTNTDGSTNNPGNLFNFNAVTAINLAVTGTANLSYDINNNTISNAISATIAAPHDEFTFSFNGTSGVAPFIITNLSDPGVNITGVTWNLAGTPATFSPDPILVGRNPIIQPINGTDITTGLTAINGATIIQGSNPLRIAGTNVIAGVGAGQTGLVNFGQVLPLTFNTFAPSTAANPLNFQATALLQQNGGSAALTSAATNGSTMTVTFSNGLTSTVKVSQPDPTSVGVSAQGDVFGTATPGFGGGSDGIHVSAGGASVLNTSTIEHNVITGYGGYGVHVETSGTADASHIQIHDNTIQQNGTGVNGAGQNVFTGGGINVTRADSSTLAAVIQNNVVTLNFNSGLEIDSSGTTTGSFNVVSQNNDFRNNAGNGLQIDTSGASILNYSTFQDNFSGNGGGSGKNVAVTGGDDIAITTSGTSVANLNMLNVLANNANGNGLSATTNDSSTLNLVVNTASNVNFTGSSSFSTNKLNGILLTSNNTSYMHANIYNTIANNNTLDGIAFARTGAAYVRSTIAGTTMSNNGVNGFSFHGLGSDPQDPTQQNSGSPNKIILLNDTLTFNGDFATGVGQGARLDLFGDSELVLDANNTTFSNNAQNGIRIKLDPGAEFGYELGNERSVLDNVTVNNNGSNGIFLTSDISPVDPNSNNNHLPFDAPSVTFMQISSNTGNTTISNNGFGTNGATGLNGILMQYLGGNHDILITGDENPAAPNYTTLIQGNNQNGIQSQTSAEGDVLLTIDKVTIGGPALINGNGKNGIDFETVALLTIVDGASTEVRGFTQTGIGTLNVSNSLIQNNGYADPNNVGNGINLVSLDTINGIVPVVGGGNGTLSATLTNNQIINNAGDGVNILLQGTSGDVRLGSGFTFGGLLSTFTLTGNTIANNGQFGVRMEQNAANQFNFFSDFNDPQPTNPPQPFNPDNLFIPFPPGFANEGNQTDLLDGDLLSNWMQLETFNNARLNLYNNTIQGNGTLTNLRESDGVFIRVSTDSYLAADIQSNNISGNVGNDLHIESFIQYNPNNGAAYQPPASIARAAPALDRVFYDNTAQLDLRLVGNVGNTVNIQSPLVNFGLTGVGGILQGSSTPNGAFYTPESLKDNFSFNNPEARMVQLFQVDNGINLNTLNSFTQNGTTQDLNTLFIEADWHLRQVADPLFPNPLFAEQYSDSPGNPFLQ